MSLQVAESDSNESLLCFFFVFLTCRLYILQSFEHILQGPGQYILYGLDNTLDSQENTPEKLGRVCHVCFCTSV